MKLWNFSHGIFFITRNLHTYEFLAIVVAAVMLVLALIHVIRAKNKEKKFEEELRNLSGVSSPEKKTNEVEGEKQ